MKQVCRLHIVRTPLLALLAGATILLAGCGVGSLAGNSGDVTPEKVTGIQGLVHGGQQPVTGAVIQLWQAGSGGYGSAAAPLISAVLTTSDGTGTVNSNANAGNANNSLPAGSFTITGDYSCTGDNFLYITATGGNPGAGTNSAVQMVNALGACSSYNAGSYIVINELTTAATAFALGQYFTTTFGGSSTDSFGGPASTQGQTGFTNAFATVNSLVNVNSGNAVTSTALTGASVGVTATPESAKLTTIANILASCVNSTGPASTACATLFSSVAPTGATAPTDTLQAAVYLSLNPTSNNSGGSTTNLTSLFGLQTASPAFSGGLSAQPTDWTVGIAYVDTTANTFLTEPQNIAIDSAGNVWVVNNSPGSLVELSPTGTPLENLLTSATTGSGLNGASARNMAIDTLNDVWVTSSSSSAYVYEYTAGGVTNSATTSKSSYGLAIDGNNNVFVGDESTSAHFEIYEFPGANTATPIVYPIATATPGTAGTNGASTYLEPEYMAFDTAGNLWMTDGSQAATTTNEVVQLSNINISACNPYVAPAPCPAGGTAIGDNPLPTSTTENTYTTFDPTTMTTTFGVAATTNGMWVASSGTGTGTDTISNISLSGASGTSYGSNASFSLPHYLAVDGSGNVWAPNKNGPPGSVSELSSTGTILSPVNTGTAPFTAVGYSHTGLTSSLGVGIDPSGNVWVANNVSGTGGIFEIVGAATPTVTPIALALKNSTVAAKP